ncbi:VWD domain-containing protein [Nocardia sp.]|uniref:VWD domain-containing protein n=1 Tax=Nocardia sp. TaxID=1821 RepID=UPI00258831BE|nr:VWD domain-containing protein [Nocardia sp.]
MGDQNWAFARRIGRRWRYAIFVIGLALGVSAVTGVGQAVADEPGLKLSITSDSEFISGQSVSMVATVLNSTGSACRLASVAEGTVTLELERDGRPVLPELATATYPEGYDAVLDTASGDVAPGSTISFPLVVGPGSHDAMLRSVTPLSGGSSVAELWPVTEPGHYVLRVSYQMPRGAQGLCGSDTGIVEVPFAVGPARGAGDGAGSTRWVVVALAAAVIAAALLISIVVYRRRLARVTGRALTLLVVVVIAVGAFGGQGPPQARATIDAFDFDDTRYLGFKEAVQDCLNKIEIIFSADALGVLGPLRKPGFSVEIFPNRQGVSEATHYTNKTRIVWDWKDTKPFKSDPTVANNPCATLYHELVHAYDNALGTLDVRQCVFGGGTVGRIRLGPEIAEVHAVRAENQFRVSVGLPERHNYGGYPLPPGRHPDIAAVLEACQVQSGPPKPPHPTTSGSEENPSVGTSDGDPHLVTFDGHHFDFQAVGEFVLARSPDFEVQVRQSPVHGSRVVSINTDAAIRAGRDHLTFTVDGGRLKYRTEEGSNLHTGTTTLPHGTVITANETGSYTVRSADGNRVDILPTTSRALRVLIYPDKRYRGQFSGLLGNFDGDSRDDLPSEQTYADIYGPAVADKWRVTRATSLLYYPQGTSTETFTDTQFLKAALNTVVITAGCVLVSMALGIGFALLLDRKFLGRGVVRTAPSPR